MMKAFASNHLTHLDIIRWRALEADYCVPWRHIALQLIRFHCTTTGASSDRLLLTLVEHYPNNSPIAVSDGLHLDIPVFRVMGHLDTGAISAILGQRTKTHCVIQC